jgi:hypothetical protein
MQVVLLIASPVYGNYSVSGVTVNLPDRYASYHHQDSRKTKTIVRKRHHNRRFYTS